MNYNFPKMQDNEYYIVINRHDLNHEILPLDNIATHRERQEELDRNSDKFNLIFLRYKKLFLVTKKAIKKPGNLKEKDIQNILKYL